MPLSCYAQRRVRAPCTHCCRAVHRLCLHRSSRCPSLAKAEADTMKCACRAEEDVGPYLPAARRSYVFGSLAAQAARIIIWLLPEVQVSLPAAAVWAVAETAPPELRLAADHCCLPQPGAV